MRGLLACLLIWLGGAAFAETGCLRPVEDGPTDQSAAFRYAARFHAIPGYPHALIHFNGFHTIRDGRLESLENIAYPHSASWAYKSYDVASDGTVYGYGGRHPNRVYRMRPGEDRFTEVPVEGYRGVRYDARSGHLLFRFEDRPLQEWTEEAGLRPSPLAGASPEMNDLLPMYFAGAAGYMSFSGDQLYWRAETAGDWQRVRLGWFDRHVPNDIWTLDPRRSYLDAASGLFALQFSQDLLVFDVSGNGVPELLYAVRDVTRVFHADDGPIVAVLGGVLLDKKRRQHFVRVIGRDGPHRVRADDATVGETAKSLAVPWNGVVPSGRGVPPLFGIGHPVFNVGLTWMYFDGAQFIAAPELGLEKTGPHPRWIQWQERLFLLDLRGWWEVQRDLTLTPGALPISFEWMFEVEIEVSETFDAIFAGHSEQGLWVSRNGLDFARVETGDVPIRRYVTDLPGGEAGVVLADDGLYLIDGTCVDEVVR